MYPPESSSIHNHWEKRELFNRSPAECTCKQAAYVGTLPTHHKWSTWQMLVTHTLWMQTWQTDEKHTDRCAGETLPLRALWHAHLYVKSTQIWFSVAACTLTSRRTHAHAQTCSETTSFPILEGKKEKRHSIYWLSPYSKNPTHL